MEDQEKYNKIESIQDRLSNNRKITPSSYQQYQECGGKLQPQNIETEEAVLGALIIEGCSIVRVSSILKTDIFYKEEHKIIFNAISELYQQNKPIDTITVVDCLRKNAQLDLAGGPYYVGMLTNKVGSSANIEFHSRLLVEKYILREIIRGAQVIQQEAFEDTSDPFDLLNKYLQIGNDIINFISESDISTAKDAMKKVYEAFENPDLSYIPSSFSTINNLLKGYARGELIEIGGWPGDGKTALIGCELNEISKTIPCLFFSLDMSEKGFMHRIISLVSGIESWLIDRLKSTDEPMKEINIAAKQIEDRKLFIYDRSIDILKLRALSRKLKFSDNIGFIAIDYGTKIKFDRNRYKSDASGYAYIASELKDMAKELNIPVVVLLQLKRVSEKGKIRRPVLSDLKESGGWEEAADKVIFVFRPESHTDLVAEYIERGEFDKIEGIVNFIPAKNRQGSIKEFVMGFQSKLMKFYELDKNEIHISDNYQNFTEPKENEYKF